MAGTMSLLRSGEYPTLGDPFLVATVTFAVPPRPVLRMWPEIVSPSCQLDSHCTFGHRLRHSSLPEWFM